MTPQQYLIKKIVKDSDCEEYCIEEFGEEWIEESFEDIEEAMWKHTDSFYDVAEEIRTGSVATGLSVNYSRHYETKEVACKCGDKWVGWTYYYGGGKHSVPEAIEWVPDAYFVECEEKEVTIIQKTFSLSEEGKDD